MKKATIVIPNYNGIKYIEMCLGSLFAQMDKEECQVLVVDNGSKDGSLQLIEDKFPEVRLIALPENTGFCHAVNVGIEKADTPYVILLNNDTKVLPGFTDGLIRAIEKDLKLFAVSALMLQWDDPTLVDDAGDRYCALGWAWSRGKGKKAENYKLPSGIFAACGGAAVLRLLPGAAQPVRGAVTVSAGPKPKTLPWRFQCGRQFPHHWRRCPRRPGSCGWRRGNRLSYR